MKNIKTDAVFHYWDGGHICVSANNSECFISNLSLNPLINWLNLFKEDIQAKKRVAGHTTSDEGEPIVYTSFFGIVAIYTREDMVQLTPTQLQDFVAWLNNHKKLLKIREVWP